MGIVTGILGILYLCGFNVGTPLAICAIITFGLIIIQNIFTAIANK